MLGRTVNAFVHWLRIGFKVYCAPPLMLIFHVMGRRAKQLRQERLWIAHTELPRTVTHPFYEELNFVLRSDIFILLAAE